MTGIGADLGALAATPPPDPSRVHVVAQLVGIDGDRALVSIDGSAPIPLPYLPSTYTGITTVLVLCNPSDGGRAVYVLGPVGTQAEPPPVPPGPPGDTVEATVTILPTWSGTWRVDRGAWDRWNADRYGGRSDLYQGAYGSSGTLIGLATYGEQIVGLGATEIVAATVHVQRNPSGASAAVTVQGSPHGTPPAGAPSSSGDTASSPTLAPSGSADIALTSGMREALRTGAAKGLALVGSDYAGVYGTSRADGMALRITYRRPA